MGTKTQVVSTPFQQTTQNTFDYKSMPGTDPNQVVSDYQNYKIDLDPGAEQRRQLREQQTENKWNSSLAGGIPTQLRMALQGEEQRGNQQVADYDRQNAQYAQSGMELARKQSLLPQLVQSGGSSSGYNSQIIQKPSPWNAVLGAAATVGGALMSDPRLKDIKGKSDEGLDANKRLHPIVYKYKQGTGLDSETHHGFNAKEVEGVKPEAVSRVQMHDEPDADDMGGPSDNDADNQGQGMRAINLERLVAMHTNAINELSDKIDKAHSVKRPKIRRGK